MELVNDIAIKKGIHRALLGMALNAFLALIKGLAGVYGNSYALIADAVESAADILTGFLVIAGLKVSRKPADENHPYGHGKFEPLTAVIVSLCLIAAAIVLSVESIHEIITPHESPKAFTLVVLLLAIASKEYMFRSSSRLGSEVGSTAISSDAWHHRSDAITSLAAFIGISISLIGGEGYAAADDFAALLASLVIATNASLLLGKSLSELLDAARDKQIAEQVRAVALHVPDVLGTHKCHVRKLGLDLFVDLDVLCNPDSTIREGHEIAHNVGEAIHRALPAVAKVLVHIEPADDFGRRNRDNLGE